MAFSTAASNQYSNFGMWLYGRFTSTRLKQSVSNKVAGEYTLNKIHRCAENDTV